MAAIHSIGRTAALTVLGGAFVCLTTATPARAVCVGDCTGINMVLISDLILGVNILLGSQPVSACPEFANAENMVTVSQLIQGVNNALGSCPAEQTPTASPTVTPTGVPTGTATATATPTTGTAVCALTPGVYTITQASGGKLKVGPLAAFDFPAGGTLVQEVGPADANCVHDTVVPFPGGFNSPVFCIAALNYTVRVDQTGCGVGKIDSNGGSDFTITEKGDTSDSSSTCNLPQANCMQGADASIRVDIQVGDGIADTCQTGIANAIVSIPVFTVTWRNGASTDCPDPDGMYNEGVDILATEFPQVLDFTTDTSTASWNDLDGDGCAIAGLEGAASKPTNTGTCLDLTAGTVTTVATGPVGATSPPLYDLTFTTKLPNTISGPEPLTGATCDNPPVINFSGVATRCIH